MWQNNRSSEQEILDLGPEHYSAAEYDRCLELLCRVNRVLGGFRATRKAFKALKEHPISILEVGCGGGYQCRDLHQLFPEAIITGIDINRAAIAHAKKLFSNTCGDKVSFHVQQDKSLKFPDKSFDAVTATLVCHHMSDDELVLFLQECSRISSRAVIINDLHRHILAYLSYSLIAPFAFPSRLLWHDGRLSIKKSFRHRDWIGLMKKAGFNENHYELNWHWAFRWTLTIKTVDK